MITGEEVAATLGVRIHRHYTYTKCYGVPEEKRKAADSQCDESGV